MSTAPTPLSEAPLDRHSDVGTSVIRTLVPIVVGALVSLLAAAGLDVQATDLQVAVTAIVTAVYYGAVRWAEQRWPAAGYLLGRKAQPVYVQPPARR